MASNKEIKLLIKRLCKESEPDSVIAELVVIGEPAIPALLSVIAQNPKRKDRARNAIVHMGNRAEPCLIKHLAGQDFHLRAAATAFLAESGSSEAIQAIQAELEREIERSKFTRRNYAIAITLMVVAGVIVYQVLYWTIPLFRRPGSTPP